MVQPFFDPVTGTVTYLVFQSGHQGCAIIGPVLDYDPKSGRTATTNADRVIEFVRQSGVHVKWILETHAHADHLSAAHYLRGELGGAIAIGEHIRASQGVFKKLFNAEPGWETTMLAQRMHRIHVHDGVAEEQFFSMREARNATLAMSVLILHFRAGKYAGGHFASCRGKRHPLPYESLKRALIQTRGWAERIRSARARSAQRQKALAPGQR
jgi:hypothetical protein